MKLSPRVALGASLLDRESPDWEWRIDTDILSMVKPDWCVLGQLYGKYWEAVDFLFGKDNPSLKKYAADHGFAPYADEFYSQWEVLTDEWTNLILFRRGERMVTYSNN